MDKKIDIVWKSYHEPEIIARGYWDNGLLEEIFAKGNFEHHTDFENVSGGAVVIVNGRTHIEDTGKINADIQKLTWCLFIITGDEESVFPWREIKHPVMKVWVMSPRMNQHDDVSFHLPNGYRPTTMKILKETGEQERQIDWFFAGQVTHDRRRQCAEVAHGLEGYVGQLYETDGFGKGLDYETYLLKMARSKIVLCPSGPETPDSFRLYEALEAGCLPIVDAFSTNHQTPGFWKYLFGDDIPFPIVSYWDKLPELLPELLKDYPANANRCFAWWQQKKRALYYKLEDDIKELYR